MMNTKIFYGNGDMNEDAAKAMSEKEVLHIDDLNGRLRFIDPVNRDNLQMLRDQGIDYRAYLEEVIDPNYTVDNYLRKAQSERNGIGGHRFKFGNDFYDEFNKQVEEHARYSNLFDIIEAYAVRRKDAVYRFPYFFDPISSRVRIAGIVGCRYFLSENGYVCNVDDYLYENEGLKMRRKYVLL